MPRFFDGKCLLRAPIPCKGMLHDTRTMCPRDFCRPICTEIINDEHFICKGNALDAVRKALLLVFRQYDGRKFRHIASVSFAE